MKKFKQRKRIVNIKNNFPSYFLILTILNIKKIIINYVKEITNKNILEFEIQLLSPCDILKTKDIRFLQATDFILIKIKQGNATYKYVR